MKLLTNFPGEGRIGVPCGKWNAGFTQSSMNGLSPQRCETSPSFLIVNGGSHAELIGMGRPLSLLSLP